MERVSEVLHKEDAEQGSMEDTTTYTTTETTNKTTATKTSMESPSKASIEEYMSSVKWSLSYRLWSSRDQSKYLFQGRRSFVICVWAKMESYG